MTDILHEHVDVVKPIAALLSDPDQGPFRVLIIDSIIGRHGGRCRLSEGTCPVCVLSYYILQYHNYFGLAVFTIITVVYWYSFCVVTYRDSLCDSSLPGRVQWERRVVREAAEGT